MNRPCSPNEVAPLDFLNRLWRRKWWNALLIAGSILASVLYLDRASRLYEVRASLLLQPNAHGLHLGEQHNDRPHTELLATHAEVLAGRMMLARAVDAYIDTNGERDPQELVTRLASELRVKRVVGTQILSVTMRSDDPQLGETLVGHLFDQYEDFLEELNQGGQVEALRTLTQTEAEIRGQLDSLQERYRDLRESSPLVGDADVDLALQQRILEDLGTAYLGIRTRRISLENRLVAVQEKLPQMQLTKNLRLISTTSGDQTSMPLNQPPSAADESESMSDDVGWGALQMLTELGINKFQDPVGIQKELFAAEVHRQELVKRFGPKHHELQAVESQITDWKARLQSMVDSAPQTLQREMVASKLQEDHLRSIYEGELSVAKQLDQRRLEQLHLQNQIEQVQSLHASTVTQLASLRLDNKVTTEGGANLRVTILEEPEVGPDAVWPNEKLVLGGGLFMGLLGSTVLALIPLNRRESEITTESAD